MKGKIIIFTGPIHSGKTTALTNYIENRKNVKGLLCPDLSGVRHVQFLSSSKIESLQVDETFINPIVIGKYFFDPTIMKEGSDHLSNIKINDDDTIILDEIGKLELKDRGFEPGVSSLITDFKNSNAQATLILVVRDYLVDEVIEKYKLINVEIKDISNLT